MRYEPAVIASQSQKLAQLFFHTGLWGVSYSHQLVCLGLYSPLSYGVTEVVKLGESQLALSGVDV